MTEPIASVAGTDDDGPDTDARETGHAAADGQTATDGRAAAAGQTAMSPSIAWRASVVLGVLGLAWLAAMLWSAHASILAAGAESVALSTAADAFPVVVSASLLAGLATSAAVLDLLGVRTAALRARSLPRIAVGFGVGLLVGAAALGLILFGYGHATPIVVLAIAVAVASAIGGLAAAAGQSGVTSAGVAATLTTFLVGILFSLAKPRLLSVFGAGASVVGDYQANTRVALLLSLISGLAAGVVGYLWLRRREPGARWPGFLLAGITPGVLLLVAELVTRVGGAQLLGQAKKLSPEDAAVVSYLGGTRLDHALIVLFVAAIVAVVLHGRTLGSATAGPTGDRDEQPEDDADDADPWERNSVD